MTKKINKRLYGEITKVEDNEDGTITVLGIASTEARDSQKEIVTAGAMKAAIPDYMKFGAVREMHGASAAGTALGVEVSDDNITRIEAHIVDPVAITKVRTKVYKGFSIGGRVTERDAKDKSIIKGLDLFEISLVDRPANPEAVLEMFKADGIDEEEEFIPTNDAVAKVATDLATAAGDATKWVDHIEAARDQLIKAHAAEDAAEGTGGVDEATPDATSAAQSTEEAGITDGDDDHKAAKPKTKDKSDATDDSGKAMTAVEPPSGEAGDWKQVWTTKDGKTFDTKADAVAHAAVLKVKEAEASNPLTAGLAALSAAVGKAAGDDDKDDKKKKPYGNVTYADPTNNKYPIDTPAHIRAAWSYINMPKNQKDYSAAEVSSIKAKIVAAWKDKIDKDGPPSAEKMVAFGGPDQVFKIMSGLTAYAEPVGLAKGMYTVARLAQFVESLQYLTSSVMYEEKAENDTESKLPQMAADLLASAATFLVEMAQEESGELLVALQNQGNDLAVEVICAPCAADVIEMAIQATTLCKADTDLLAKVGARNSKADQDRVQAIHDHAASMGAKCDKGEDDADKMAKSETLMQENESLRKQIGDALPLLEELRTKVANLEAQPRPSAPRTHVIGKGQDNGDGLGGGDANPATAEEMLKKFTPDEIAIAAFKVQHATGGTQLMKRGR